ncbi:MAG: large subunit ribosomal protein L4 [Gammaproteobacteria bacterium]|jgi:large subunit ribosomal protein L4
MSVQLKLTGGSGSVEVSDQNFGADFNEALIHQVVTAYMAGGRAGTSSQKSRGEVRGGGRKPHAQKGTGRARAGTIRSPIWTGGGQTFARSTRSYAQKVNRKMYRGAMRSILSELARQDRLVVLSDLDIKAVKTKDFVAQLAKLEIDKGLIVTATADTNLALSARNVKHIDTMVANQIDPVSLVAYDKVIMTADALKQIDEALV